MKGIILAGGKGTRLSPLTKITNKHLLPVGTEPMIFNPIRQMVSAGIRDILVISSKESMGDIVNALGSGKKFECSFTFKVQEEPNGIADALLLGENFACGDSIIVILGDNILTKSIKTYVDEFKHQNRGAKILLKKVNKPHCFGVAVLDGNRITKIVEKPLNPLSKFAVIGVYIYDNNVFDIIKDTSISPRGELEITCINNAFIAKNQLTYDILEGDWIDAGTFETYKHANDILYSINNKIIEGDL